jgi:hypothetical protein
MKMRNRISENQKYQEEAHVSNPEKEEAPFKVVTNRVPRNSEDDKTKFRLQDVQVGQLL